VQDRSLSEIGGKGLFVKEIEEALLDGRADFAVHSLKDVPPELPPGLEIGFFPKREDPRDVLISRRGLGLLELPAGSSVGTSSLRRRVQLLEVRPDLSVLVLRGNVDTRLRKCREGELDAIVLAHAGLLRLGLSDAVTQVLEPDVMLPAVAQGALAIEFRADDASIQALLAPLEHLETKIAVMAERAVMRAVEGSCQAPVAAHAVRHGDRMRLSGLLADPDGTNLRRAEVEAGWPAIVKEAEAVGFSLGGQLRTRR
jgi:hydroxymethylbilane synthase